MSASRAAFIGGCSATSNLLAGKVFAIPVKGTHAHSWVLSFEDEPEAFEAYAQALPNNCVFLVDTYNSLTGVDHAIKAGQRLRAAGIRLDSGDLAYLSVAARKRLDAAGFQTAIIVASNDLDEHLITSLKQQGAKVNVWGVGTRLVTAYDQPALGGVYKLTAIQDTAGDWVPKLKISEQTAKVTTPGRLQVRRFEVQGEFVGDALYDLASPPGAEVTIVDPADPMRRKRLPPQARSEDLLIPVLRNGELVTELPSLETIQSRTRQQLRGLHPSVKRLVNPHAYPAGLSLHLHETKTQLILKARHESLDPGRHSK